MVNFIATFAAANKGGAGANAALATSSRDACAPFLQRILDTGRPGAADIVDFWHTRDWGCEVGVTTLLDALEQHAREQDRLPIALSNGEDACDNEQLLTFFAGKNHARDTTTVDKLCKFVGDDVRITDALVRFVDGACVAGTTPPHLCIGIVSVLWWCIIVSDGTLEDGRMRVVCRSRGSTLSDSDCVLAGACERRRARSLP